MGDRTGISWTDATWNPVVGCTRVSAGCDNCYAAREAATRLSHTPQYRDLAVITGSGRAAFNGTVRLLPERLDQPLRWHRSRKVFVNSMSDLFHEAVPFDFVDRVFAVMVLASQHTFQVLTKRPERMLRYFGPSDEAGGLTRDVFVEGEAQKLHHERTGEDPSLWLAVHWPLPNVWLVVSVEDQPTADQRLPLLLQTPALVRGVSAEPLLAPIKIDRWMCGEHHDPAIDCRDHPPGGGLDWVVIGGESGPQARPFDIEWARDLVAQCRAARVPVFYKQGGSSNACVHDRKGGCLDCAPPDLRVMEWPNGS